ncbi:hypothetical protein G6F50_017606 [Rhizopus delemar]|uniref:Uncharacterized protein n=1 Tax=Rhizopus delemar TaxID=936053 RepID=A0A9P7BZI7_9FUNG|nr:hypothetical protein G6F50_017606 [Rhizopus delemar]
MELEGYELVMRAVEVALAIRREVARHPLISRYFSVLGADKMIPQEFRQSGFTDYLASGMNWLTAVKALKDDEFCLDPTRLTLRSVAKQYQQYPQRCRRAHQGAGRDI